MSTSLAKSSNQGITLVSVEPGGPLAQLYEQCNPLIELFAGASVAGAFKNSGWNVQEEVQILVQLARGEPRLKLNKKGEEVMEPPDPRVQIEAIRELRSRGMDALLLEGIIRTSVKTLSAEMGSGVTLQEDINVTRMFSQPVTSGPRPSAPRLGDGSGEIIDVESTGAGCAGGAADNGPGGDRVPNQDLSERLGPARVDESSVRFVHSDPARSADVSDGLCLPTSDMRVLQERCGSINHQDESSGTDPCLFRETAPATEGARDSGAATEAPEDKCATVTVYRGSEEEVPSRGV